MDGGAADRRSGAGLVQGLCPASDQELGLRPPQAHTAGSDPRHGRARRPLGANLESLRGFGHGVLSRHHCPAAKGGPARRVPARRRLSRRPIGRPKKPFATASEPWRVRWPLKRARGCSASNVSMAIAVRPCGGVRGTRHWPALWNTSLSSPSRRHVARMTPRASPVTTPTPARGWTVQRRGLWPRRHSGMTARQ